MNGQASRLIQLKRLAEKEKYSSSSKIISVCSGKGGTGKTFFSANFADQLSKLDFKILLIDLDLNFSNLNIMLNQTSDHSIANFFEQKNSLEEIIIHYSSHLDLIFGDSGRADYPRISREILDYFFYSLSRIQPGYDYIILDSSAGADELVLHQLIKSDLNIIVTSPEPTAVMDAYVVIKMLKENGSDAKKFVIVNKCADSADCESAFGNLSTAVKHFLEEEIDLLGSISFDSAVYKSIMHQELLSIYAPQSQSILEIGSICSRFKKIEQVANNNQSLLNRSK